MVRTLHWRKAIKNNYPMRAIGVKTFRAKSPEDPDVRIMTQMLDESETRNIKVIVEHILHYRRCNNLQCSEFEKEYFAEVLELNKEKVSVVTAKKEIIPLRPEDVPYDSNKIPSIVIEAVNNLIKDKFLGRNYSFEIDENDIVLEIYTLDPNADMSKIYLNGGMNFEPLFSQFGWHIAFEKTGYDEDYDGRFIFKAATS